MTGSTDQHTRKQPVVELPAALADYADRLLLGTDLDAAHAVLIARLPSWFRTSLRSSQVARLHSTRHRALFRVMLC